MTREELTEFLAERERASQENSLDRWRREVREREARLAHERNKDRNLTDAEMQRWVDHVHELIANEREFQREAVAQAVAAERERMSALLVELIAEMQDAAADDLERATRSLTVELGEVRATLAELRATLASDRAKVVDLPRLPDRRELN